MPKQNYKEIRQVVDTTSGETISYSTRRVMPFVSFQCEPFGTYFRSALAKLADMELSTSARRLILVVLSEVEDENLLNIAPTMMARRLGVDRTTVHRAVKELEQANVIFRTAKVLNVSHRLNPRVAWFSRASNRPQDLTGFPEVGEPDRLRGQHKPAKEGRDVNRISREEGRESEVFGASDHA